jgi:hypothetical protein
MRAPLPVLVGLLAYLLAMLALVNSGTGAVSLEGAAITLGAALLVLLGWIKEK